MGVTSDIWACRALFEAGADAVIDTAHGHSAGFFIKIAEIRAHFPDRTLICKGNIATAEGARALYDTGGTTLLG